MIAAELCACFCRAIHDEAPCGNARARMRADYEILFVLFGARDIESIIKPLAEALPEPEKRRALRTQRVRNDAPD